MWFSPERHPGTILNIRLTTIYCSLHQNIQVLCCTSELYSGTVPYIWLAPRNHALDWYPGSVLYIRLSSRYCAVHQTDIQVLCCTLAGIRVWCSTSNSYPGSVLYIRLTSRYCVVHKTDIQALCCTSGGHQDSVSIIILTFRHWPLHHWCTSGTLLTFFLGFGWAGWLSASSLPLVGFMTGCWRTDFFPSLPMGLKWPRRHIEQEQSPPLGCSVCAHVK